MARLTNCEICDRILRGVCNFYKIPEASFEKSSIDWGSDFNLLKAQKMLYYFSCKFVGLKETSYIYHIQIEDIRSILSDELIDISGDIDLVYQSHNNVTN